MRTTTHSRLRKGLAVSTAAFVLPVLGTVGTPAFAQANENASQQGQTQSAAAASHGGGAAESNAGGNGQAAGTNAGGNGQAPETSQSAGTSGATAGENDPKDAENPKSEDVDNGDGNGANYQDGPYESTEVGQGESEGNGHAPANGTVGNADDKNPKGQLQSAATDGNNGYECDSNRGIGDDGGNPAHTSCASGTTPPPDKPENPDEPDKPGNPDKPENPDEPGSFTPSSPTTPGAPAFPFTPGQPTGVLTETLVRPTLELPTFLPGTSTPGPTVRATVVPSLATAGPAALPFTGDATGLVALVALSSLTVGGALAFAARRQTA